MSTAVIEQLLKHNNDLWQASAKKRHRPAVSTGYPALDQQLHYQGWPQGALTELLLAKNGIGEIRLLCPLLARLSQQQGYICWLNPPFRPYAPALIAQGIELKKLLFIHCKNTQDTIWAAQQALSSGSCSAVLSWLPQQHLTKEVRKLSLAAKNGNCWGFVFRDQQLQQQPSTAALRIVMSSRQARQQLSIIKQPGGWSGQQVSLNLFPERAYWNSQPASQWPVYKEQKDDLKQAKLKLTELKHAKQSLKTKQQVSKAITITSAISNPKGIVDQQPLNQSSIAAAPAAYH